MKNPKSIIKTLIATFLFAALVSAPVISRAGHDHDHIYVQVVDYLGHDRSTGLHMLEVNHYYQGHSHYIIVYLVENASSLRGHRNDTVQISLSNGGNQWARLSMKGHGTWNISHTRSAR